MAMQFNELIQSDKPVLVDFFAEWCGPCKMMAPILQEVARQTDGQASVVKIDVDRNPAVSQAYQIRAVPTLILFRQGKAVWRHSGVASAAELTKIIRQYSPQQA